MFTFDFPCHQIHEENKITVDFSYYTRKSKVTRKIN